MKPAAVALLVLLFLPGVACADMLQDLGATYEQVAKELAAAFPKAETRIIAVEAGPPATVRLAGPGAAALRPGLELTAYRKGEAFRHPLTGQVLGYTEDEVAVLTVTEATADGAMARVAVTEGSRTPGVGDGARITAGRIPVAVLPTLGVAVSGESAQDTDFLLTSRFSALLEKTGRFLAVDPRRVLDTVTPPGGGTPPSPLEVAQKLKAPAVLTARVVQDGRARTLETTWLSGRTGATLVTLRTPLVKAVYPPRFAWEQTPELERRQQLDGPVRGVAVADLDGDGRPELIVGDDRGLTMFRWREGGAPIQFWGSESRSGTQILSLDAADINGTGRAQVVLVEYRGSISDALRSTVLEWTGERLQPIYEVTGRFLRIIPVGGERWLVEQSVGRSEPFDTTIRRLIWEDGRYRDGASMRVPGGVSVYGLALMRLTGAAEPEIVALTSEDRLAVWTAQGRRLWTSGDSYGGAPFMFPFTPAIERRDPDPLIVRILGRIIGLPGGPEGPEILVFENALGIGGQFRSLIPTISSRTFSQGKLHRLRWKDGGFIRIWESRTTDGYIADFGFGDLDGDGSPEVVVGVVPRGLNLDTLNPFSRPKGHLVFYELP